MIFSGEMPHICLEWIGLVFAEVKASQRLWHAAFENIPYPDRSKRARRKISICDTP